MKRRYHKLINYLSNRLHLSKRQQFVIVVTTLTLGILSTQLLSGGLQIEVIVLLGAAAYILSALVLRQDLSGWEFLTLLTLPTLFTIAVFLFYYLLPIRWLTRLPIAGLYAVGMYAILLTENIYNVAAERNIQLLRAAHSVGFLLTLVTLFFLIETVLSLHLPFYLNTILSIPMVFLLTVQALWSMELTPNVTSRIWSASAVVTLIIAELVGAFSFWPARVTIQALFFTTVFYSLVGMTQQFLIERLFPKTAREYVLVLLAVFILVIITTKWGAGIQ